MRDRKHRRVVQHRRIVRTVNGNDQVGAADVAIRVGDGVDEGLRQSLTGIEFVDRGVGIVHAIRVTAIVIEDQATVGAVERNTHCLAGTAKADAGDRGSRAVSADAVGSIAVTCTGEYVAGGGGRRCRCAFTDTVGIGIGRRRVVNDSHGQDAAVGCCTGIENAQRNGVRSFRNTRLAQVGFERVAVAQGPACRNTPDRSAYAKPGQAQCAFAGINNRGRGTAQGRQRRNVQGRATHRDAGQSVQRRDRHGAGSGFCGVNVRDQAGFCHRRLARCRIVAVDRCDRRRAVGMAIDGDGQLCNIGEGNISEGHIGDGVGKAVGKTLSGLQLIDRCVSCVERIGVAAICCNRQGAVAPGQRSTK